MQGNRKFEKTCKRDGKVFQFQRTTRLWTILVTIRSVNPRSVLKRANKTSILKIGMTTDGNHACIPKLGGEFRALLLVLVLLSRPEVWLQSRSRLGIPCRLIWKPILLDTAGRYHEYHATIHWKHESGWSVVVDFWSGLCSPQRFWLIWTHRGLCLYSSWACRLSILFYFSAMKILKEWLNTWSGFFKS